MSLIKFLENDLITDNTKEYTPNKLFLKTSQNARYATNISNFITPSILLKNLNLDTNFIGITGTNGKTTTAFVLSYFLKKLGFNVLTQGTEGLYYNLVEVEGKNLTTPSILTTIKRAFKYKADFFVMEVSSHAIAQNRIESINFYAKLFTSFSQDHLDFHKTIEEYRKVKESFFKDSESYKILKCILNKDKCIIDGYNFNINRNNFFPVSKPLLSKIPLIGEFNKFNFSLALKTTEIIANNFQRGNLLSDLDEFNFNIPGRMEIISNNPYIIIDFAHTPDGIKKVLENVNGKKLVLFGAGGNRDKTKRALMGKYASQYADYIILTNDNPRCENPLSIINDIKKGLENTQYEIILDRKKAIKKALMIKNSFDYIFILGKGNEKTIEFCNKKIYFNDKEEILKNLN